MAKEARLCGGAASAKEACSAGGAARACSPITLSPSFCHSERSEVYPPRAGIPAPFNCYSQRSEESRSQPVGRERLGRLRRPPWRPASEGLSHAPPPRPPPAQRKFVVCHRISNYLRRQVECDELPLFVGQFSAHAQPVLEISRPSFLTFEITSRNIGEE